MLELPGGDFRAIPPTVSLDEMMRRSRHMREWFPKGVPTEEDRLRTKVNVVFEL